MDDAAALLDRLKAHLDPRNQRDDREIYRLLASGRISASSLLTGDAGAGGSHWIVALFQGPGVLKKESIARHFDGLSTVTLCPEERTILLIAVGTRGIEDQIRGVIEANDLTRRAHVGTSSRAGDEREIPRLIREAEMAAGGAFFGRRPGLRRFSATPSDPLSRLTHELSLAVSSRDCDRAAGLVDRLPGVLSGAGG